MTFMQKVARKSKFVIASALIAVGLLAVATVTFAPRVAAAACDTVNIIHCGLTGSSTQENINSLKSIYTKNSDNGHADIRAVYNWAGWSTSDINGMTTTNTKSGTLYRNGDIKVGGKVVARDAWVSARFTEGQGFVKVKDGVWARKTTTSLEHDTYKVLVHFNSNGTFDTATMIDCGNAVRATNTVKTVQPAPAPAPTPAPAPVAPPATTPREAEVACISLTATPVADQTRTYRFTARAVAVNTTITNYVINFGDNTPVANVKTSATTATAVHTYPESPTGFNASVGVGTVDKPPITSVSCKIRVTVAPATEVPEVVVPETETPAAATPETVEECEPGIPLGDARCEEDGVTVDESQELVAAGPGAIAAGIFAGTSILGAYGYTLFQKRRLR